MTRKVEGTISSWLDKRYESSAPGGDRDEWKKSLMDYFRSLTDAKSESTLQLATAKWYCNGTVILPEDQDKCTAAVKTAVYHKVDPLSFKRPMEVLERYGEHQERVGMKPEEVPTFKLLREKDGLQIWSVENGEDERTNYENNRKFCESHFGEDIPWCLGRDFEHWKHYKAYPKEIATFNGRPIAFSANDNKRKVWWDRLDNPNENISVTKRIPSDRLHRVGTIQYVPKTLEVCSDWKDIHTGDKRNGEYRKWKSLDDEIPEYIAQYKNKQMESAVIPEGKTEIGNYALYDCSSLKEIHISDSVTKIGRSAFSGCSSLKEIHIPEGVTEIGSRTFEYCKSLKEIHIPDNVTKIGEGVFFGCKSLENIYIPDSVTEIGSRAFLYCSSLKEIHIPDSVTEIGGCVFYGCKSLIEIHIPEGVTKIGEYAFEDCKSLKKVHIPEGVTKIREYAFNCCESLTDVHIPEGVIEIGQCAFNCCESLTDIHIPEGVTKIGDSAFHCTSLTEIHIPDGVTKIGDFAFTGCKSLKEVHISKRNAKKYKCKFPFGVKFVYTDEKSSKKTCQVKM